MAEANLLVMTLQTQHLTMSRSDSCILCHSPVSHSVAGLEGYRICRNCDLAWWLVDELTDPADGWENDYYGRSEIIQFHESRKSGTVAIIARLSAVCPNRGRLLDVGAGLGILMKVAAEDGWSVEGVEPSKTAADRARKLTGAPVHNGLLEEVTLPEGHYDAVTIVDVLRQSPDPLTFLRSARRLLRPGGVLLIRETHRRIWQVGQWLVRKSNCLKLKGRRRAFDCAQVFSPKSMLYALQVIGLEGWVEPSPVFVEPQLEDGLISSLSKQVVGLGSAVIYQASLRRLIISPNLLVFGRASIR
jgi:2-polyprenyl-3-methyl-5-hydroxy-6-metoxy-1,4-benzoquinol methylase